MADNETLTQQIHEAWTSSVMSGVRELSPLFLENMAKIAAATCAASYESQIAELRHQRSLLAQDMGKLLVDSGLIRDDAALTGPELGMHFDTCATHLLAVQGLLQKLVREHLHFDHDAQAQNWRVDVTSAFIDEEDLTTEEIAVLDGWAHMMKEDA